MVIIYMGDSEALLLRTVGFLMHHFCNRTINAHITGFLFNAWLIGEGMFFNFLSSYLEDRIWLVWNLHFLDTTFWSNKCWYFARHYWTGTFVMVILFILNVTVVVRFTYLVLLAPMWLLIFYCREKFMIDWLTFYFG